MKDIYRKEVHGIKPYVQGKPAEAVRRELGLDRIEKLASNENQYGPSPKAASAMKAEMDSVNFYPESYPFELVMALAGKLGVDPDSIVVANGGEAVLWNLSMTFLNEGDEVVTAAPTFDVYRLAASYLGATVVSVPMAPGGAFDVEGMVGAVNDKTKILWLCTPNNPTGTILSQTQLAAVLARVPEDVMVVLDEAYYEFAAAMPDYPARSTDLLSKRKNFAILRTFSKIYGLAGMRVGYLLTNPEHAKRVRSVMFTFGVNRLAQVGAKAALEDDGYLADVVRRNRWSVDFLESYFRGQGWEFFPSYANFCWVDCGLDSKEVFERLQAKGVIIRPGYLWGWDSWLRVSAGTEAQMEFFARQMDAVLAEMRQ
jgi:histidinol-phosphate aminotransferase